MVLKLKNIIEITQRNATKHDYGTTFKRMIDINNSQNFIAKKEEWIFHIVNHSSLHHF